MRDDWLRLEILRPFLPSWAGKAALSILFALVAVAVVLRWHGARG